ncbi:TPA: hypothetical protein DIC20_00105 [Candidatus Dependentiae bacterium]|nr:MAG: Malonyl CoA-acyl carrier protein transacylase [candidate division TM6 bacterium GW2011_GWF2_36_131]KKQ02593.1 MAG: Malonyl CoA-acyl carrier protein transacylase [candidate division TM6 bacterium GW2011_GWE2_36_25]KKQ19088.1 MAG: Malonyl CoA-acyl carrier protein transacylase [candidate division TM6 bacterium GW2011_GWA2_36_9]HBR70178.1 hypothetical protein [Candidatus Dependentiae bacterium]HCU00090.1 hypothetical protein [Candidatus Dependentiae bacterium]
MFSRGILFPGYGSQYVGMGKDFYDKYRVVQELFEEASNCVGINFIRLCFASSEKELAKPLNAYLSLFLIQSSIFTILREHEIVPSLITGWGVGQISTYYNSGILNFPDGLYLLKKYMEFYESLVLGNDVAMVSIKGVDKITFEKCLRDCAVEESIKVAIIRDEKDFVIAGRKPAILILVGFLQKNFDIHVMPERFTYGIHMLFLNKLIDGLNCYLEKIDCKKPKYSVIDQSGSMLRKGISFNKLWLTQFMHHPIDLVEIVRQLNKVDEIIQIGPGDVTLNVVKKCFPHKRKICIKHKSDLKELL